MKKAISFALCFMLIFSLAVPSFAAGLAPKIDSIAVASERTATIINGPVRLRSSAQINNTNTLCQLNTGTEVVVKNENCAFADNYWWSYVYVPGNATGFQYGYVATNYLSW